MALADFVAPRSVKPDYLGGFVVTAGAEEGKIAERFARANDDIRRDHGQGARRPHRRSLRREDA
jgi:cobalamin-dependent methionine synthase I